MKKMNQLNINHLINVAQQFVSQGKAVAVTELGEGNINQTYLVTVDDGVEAHFVLQQINTQVFQQPQLVMNNLERFVNHVNNKLPDVTLADNRSWQTPQILRTIDGKNHYIDNNSCFWRAISYVKNAQSYNTIQSSQHAYEIGYGLGLFHTLISDLDTTQLVDTLPGFHITPNYWQQYQTALQTTSIACSSEVAYCQQFIADRTDIIHTLEQAKQQGILQLRPMHGDPKINNIMIDNSTQKAIAMVDLDTIKPGLVHYDIGDCLRSGCNVLGEETINWQAVTFDIDLAQEILRGYFAIAKSFLTSAEIDYIYDSIRLITFELGLRFFTDYLNNNVYFKTDYPEHNLQRALVQFQLAKSIEEQEYSLKKIISQLASL